MAGLVPAIHAYALRSRRPRVRHIARQALRDAGPEARQFAGVVLLLLGRVPIGSGVNWPQGERRSIANDCFALAMKVEHYNSTHPKEAPLQVVFNFEEDNEEMKIARGIAARARPLNFSSSNGLRRLL